MAKINKQQPQSLIRPPVVAVLGHVDHGKTSLLDYIRKATVAAKEFGGITQHIGAYQTEVVEEKKENSNKKIEGTNNQKPTTNNLITFIDTPGHEAFAKMRSRGATAADIAILVVAADDSVKPQTIESIEQIKAANIPLIVAINKTDLPTSNVQKVKQDLAKHSVQLEGFGGDVPFAQVSAKTGQGIQELLDLILLVWEMKGGEPVDTSSFVGNVIETRLDKGKGMTASVIVKKGILKYGTKLFEFDKQLGKIRSMSDEWGKPVVEAPPGKPVQITGFDTLPEIGSIITEVPIPKEAEKNPQPIKQVIRELPDFLKPLNEVEQKLAILLKTDTAGSMEAIETAFSSKIDIVDKGFGDINEADILMARSSKAFIVGFNVGIRPTAVRLAETEKVVYRTYTIIYELLDELTDVVAGMKEVVSGEREVGEAVILAEFPFDNQRIAGIKVLSGRVAKGDNVRIMRGEQEIERAKIKSIRKGKLEATKAEEGEECGLLFDRVVAFSLQDGIIAVIK